MDEFRQCPTCKKYDFMSRHKCPPKWKVFHEDYLGEEYEIIYSSCYEDAATEYTREFDQDDYFIIDGSEAEVQVEPFGGGERKTFIVTGEAEPTYHAEEIKENK